MASEPGPLGPWRLLRLLGRGGMGEVWEAEPASGGPHVAIKLLQTSTETDEGAVRRFLAEARMGLQLNHPNLVQVTDAQRAQDGRLWLAMELLEGRPLSTLSRGEHLPIGLAVELALQALAGLHALHTHVGDDGTRRPILHRDIKPSNLFVTDAGVLKVIDLGIAVGLDQDRTQTRTGQIRGTLRYSSPEQAKGEALDARSDLFSLGLVLYLLLTGQRVFDQENEAAVVHALVNVTAPRVTELRPEVPEAVADVVASMLERNRERRAASAQAVAQALREAMPQHWREPDVAQWLASQPRWQKSQGTSSMPVAPAGTVPERPRHKASPNRWALAGIAGLGLAAVAFAVVATLPRDVGQGPPHATLTQDAGVALATRVDGGVAAVPALVADAGPVVEAPVPDAGATLAVHPTPGSNRPGWLTVDVDRGFGRVKVDGRELGLTPLYRQSLPPGRHRLEVTRDDGATRVSKVTIKSNAEQVVRVRW